MTFPVVAEKCHGCCTALRKENVNGQIQNNSQCTKPTEKTTHDVVDRINVKNVCDGVSETVNGHNSSLENTDSDLPIELKAEFISCVMREEYQKALNLCEEMLSIYPENQTCLEFQDVIKVKLEQDGQSDVDGEDDDEDDDQEDNQEDNSEASSETDHEGSSEESSESEDDSGTDESEDDEESGDSSSESDTELPNGPINLLMGGLPLRTASRSNQRVDS